MGWKVFAVFATEEPGYFGTRPQHDAERADDIRDRLGLSGYERVGESDFETAMYPRAGALFIGAFPEGVIVCDAKLPSYFFDDGARRRINGASLRFQNFKANLLGLYPEGQVLSVVLHSVVNLWGYSLHEGGRHLRSAAGASDDGLFTNIGSPLPEEARVLGLCPIDEVDAEGYGEELTFDVSARLFGKRIDEFDGLGLQLSKYRKRNRVSSFFKGLLSAARG
ncbi:MAG: hypothetical protein H7Y33_13100 [Cytophagales bacterium]|nr:hypothetical protein [Rhizobacter sp.]